MRTRAAIAWETLYRAEGPRLWRSLLLYSGSSEVASDAMAEAFAQGIARGDAIRSPGAWVWKTAFVLAKAELAQRPAAGSDVQDDLQGVDGGVDEVIDLVDALGRLSPMQRASVVLHHYAGYPTGEVAEILGTSRSAVGVHLFRARNRLRRDLGEDSDA